MSNGQFLGGEKMSMNTIEDVQAIKHNYRLFDEMFRGVTTTY